MISLNEQTSANETASPAPPPENRCAAEVPGNGAPAGTAASPVHVEAAPLPEPAASTGAASATDRAEEYVDRVSHQVAYLAAAGTRKLVTFVSRAREALQDFWAEVQDFRRGRKP
jgi:hypothetical protein